MTFSVFSSIDRTIIDTRAGLTREEGPARWKLRNRGKQATSARELPFIAALGGSGIQIRVQDAPQTNAFSYLRGEFALSEEDCQGVLKFELETFLESAPGLVVLVQLSKDPTHSESLAVCTSKLKEDSGLANVTLSVDFAEIGAVPGTVYGYFQVCLTTVADAVVHVGRARINQIQQNSGFRKLKIRFDPFGDVTKASSRLRVWKFVELLKAQGHAVSVAEAEANVDLYFAQKKRSFKAVAAIKSQNPNAVIVYDFDDNYVLQKEGVVSELVSFINHVDVVTCGSDFLASAVRHWHPNVYVLENPVDVKVQDVVREPRRAMKRVGWFGSPEGLTELAKIGLRRKIETLTKGGDIEFDIDTVDRDLTGFDLLLFPVEPTSWNLAKNANRMIKALALGVPVLVSDTPEHRRIHELCGLPEELIIDSLDGWDERIEAISDNFEKIEAAVDGAREAVWRLFSTETILSNLFDHLAKTTRLSNSVVRPVRRASGRFAKVAALIVDNSQENLIGRSLLASSVDWTSFAALNVCAATRMQNELMVFSDAALKIYDGDFLGSYKHADAIIERCEAPYLLVLRPGVSLGYGIIEPLEAFLDQDEAQLCLFSYSEHLSPTTRRFSSASPLRELLLNPTPVGPLLVKTDWLRKQDIRWVTMLDLWPWAVAVRAMATGTPFAVEALPFAYEIAARSNESPSRNYSNWLKQNHPATASDLPNVEAQWRRILIDIVSSAALWVQHDLPHVVAQLHAANLELHAQNTDLRQRLKDVRKDVKAQK